MSKKRARSQKQSDHVTDPIDMCSEAAGRLDAVLFLLRSTLQEKNADPTGWVRWSAVELIEQIQGDLRKSATESGTWQHLDDDHPIARLNRAAGAR